MKRLCLVLLLAMPVGRLNSQSAPAAAQVITINIVPQIQAPMSELQTLKAANEATIAKQAKTLEALNELQKMADELKIYAKRS